MDKRKAVIALLVLVTVAVVSGVVLNTYSTANACQPANNANMQGWFGWNGFAGWVNGNVTMEKPAMPRGWMHGRGCFSCGFIEVSEEFKQNVINIAESDSDVQNLLNEGYNIIAVKPIIKTIVEGGGAVVTKATSAILMLEKDTTGRAFVWVDLEQAKVTRIEILTRTVIEKP